LARYTPRDVSTRISLPTDRIVPISWTTSESSRASASACMKPPSSLDSTLDSPRAEPDPLIFCPGPTTARPRAARAHAPGGPAHDDAAHAHDFPPRRGRAGDGGHSIGARRD